jgi:hypothetical protein
MNSPCGKIGSHHGYGGEMSGNCKICGYQGDELNAGHIEHAHAVELLFSRRLAEQEERHKRAIAVLTGQKKNRMIIGLTRVISRVRGELEMAQRALHQSTRDLRASIGLEEGPDA